MPLQIDLTWVREVSKSAQLQECSLEYRKSEKVREVFYKQSLERDDGRKKTNQRLVRF